MLSARGAIYDSGTQLAAPQGYDARTHGAVVELMITIIQGPAVEPQVPEIITNDTATQVP